MDWLLSVVSRLGLRLSWTWVLPSFCSGEDCMARQSGPSDFDEAKAEAIPEVGTSRDYKHAHPELIRRFIAVSSEFAQECPGRTLLVTCTYRSPKEQYRLWLQGRNGNKGPIVTNCDGKNTKSKHNVFPSRAIDVCVLIGGKPSWDEKDYYPLGPIGKKHGLEWGGFWTKFSDFAHYQLSADIV